MRERLDYIDKAKGILIIITVIGHIWQAGYVHNVIYSFHMPAFFVISGMLMCYTKSYEKTYLQFVGRRIYAFGIPFVFIEILGCLTDIIRHGVTLNIKGYIYNTLTMNFNDPNLWFIVDLFLVEVIFVFLIKVLKKDKLMWLACIILFIISVLLPEGNVYVNRIVSIFRFFLFFTSGFYGNKVLSKKHWLACCISAVIVISVAAIFGKRADGYLSVANIAFIVSGLCGSYLVVQLGKINYEKLIDWFLTIAGKNTIIIYGTHHIVYAAIGTIIGITDYASTPLFSGIVMLILVALFEIPIIYIINRWLPFLAGKHCEKIVTS